MPSAAARKTAPAVQQDAASKGARTRERILDLAYARIIEKGFAATSIEELVEAAGITKSGFFYHFRDKNDLARRLLERYLAETEAQFDAMEARARELSDDPLHAFLIFLKLYAEMVADMIREHPGCLVATITAQDRLFDREVVRLNREGVLAWRARFVRWTEEIARVYPPKAHVSLADLADQMNAVVDGAILMARALGDPDLIERQAMLQRTIVAALFR